MEFYEREFLIARISAGYLLYKVNDNVTLHINPLTKDQNYLAQLAFKEAYEEALTEGVMCPIESKEMLEEQGIWNEEFEEELSAIDKEIEKLKMDVYQSFFKAASREIARKLLRAKEAIRLELFGQKHSYDFTNAVGVATFARWNWIIEHTTTYENGSPYNWEDISVQDLLVWYKQNMLGEEKLRYLARTEPWRSIWSSGKKEGKIFDVCSTELTTEQKSLIGWSTMYDSISESPESPPDDIIEDNDALDGWLISQNQKRKREREKSVAEELTGKHPNAKDIFIKPETEEDAQRIVELNDLESQRIRSRRTQKIKNQGSVQYHKFDDVQQDLQDEIAAAQ